MTEKIIGCGALFYSKETNRFLLLHRTQSKQNRVWGLVGGTTTNELAWAGLKREIKEEIGDVKILKTIPMGTEGIGPAVWQVGLPTNRIKLTIILATGP